MGVVTSSVDSMIEGIAATIDPARLSGFHLEQLPLDSQLVNFH